MKKIVSLVLAVSMVLSMFVSAFAAGTYTDLVDGDNARYYAGAVEALTELKVIAGFENEDKTRTYGPEKELTRAQLAKMLVVCNGLDNEVESLASRTIFSDVDPSNWAAGWVNAAAQSKIIAGYPDGTFKPTKNVTYAEAFTMALRALGYGNVVDAEGTWPTAYMLKARELKLTNNLVGQFQASTPATRGNTAILLWNMLRTPMWKIYEESEGNGMTLTARNDYMLNVKFPDYRYAEDSYITKIEVGDREDVRITIDTSADENTDLGGFDGIYEAYVKNVDISRLVDGMKVTVLVKDYKNEEKKTFLTVTPTDTRIEGFITNVETDEDDENVVTFTVNEEDYKMNTKRNGNYIRPSADVAFGNYVVFEADGKKVKDHDMDGNGGYAYVINALPIDGTEVAEESDPDSVTMKKMQAEIDEDDLVIKDGEWVTVDDVEEGDVYTKVEFDDGYAWLVASEPVEGTFESLTTEVKKIDGTKTTIYYVEVDGEKLFVPLAEDMTAWEGADNSDEVALTKLQEEEKDNKYLDKDVTVVRNFVGSPLKLKFGDVDELTTGGSYYVIASNGAWSASAKGGRVYNVTLIGQDGEEVDYEFTKNATIPNSIKDNEEVYKNEIPLFAWVKFDDDDKIKEMIVFSDPDCPNPLASGDDFEDVTYKSKYTVVALASGEKFDKNDNQFETTKVTVKGGAEKELKANASTIVYTVRALLDDDDKVMGFEADITEGLDALSNKTMPDNSFAAYDATKKTARAAYVFIADDPESAELLFGLVEKYDESSSRGKDYVTINGEKYQLEDKLVNFTEDDVVGYTIKNDKITVRVVIDIADVDTSKIMDKDTDSESIVFTDGSELDLTDKSDDVEDYEDFKVVEISIVPTKKNSDRVKFDSAEEVGEGLASIARKSGNRIIIDEEEEVIYVFTGLNLREGTSGGKIVDIEESSTTPTEPEEPSEPSAEEPGEEEPSESSAEEPALSSAEAV